LYTFATSSESVVLGPLLFTYFMTEADPACGHFRRWAQWAYRQRSRPGKEVPSSAWWLTSRTALFWVCS